MKKKRFFKLMRAYNCRFGMMNKELNRNLRDYHSVKPPASYATIYDLFSNPIWQYYIGYQDQEKQKEQP